MIDLKLLEKKEENGTSFYSDYLQALKNRNGSEQNIKTLEIVMQLAVRRREVMTQSETEIGRA